MTVRVRVLGTGLIGASVGLALTRAGYEVTLSDPSPTAMSLARDLGAGRLAVDHDSAPDLIVVGAPPDVTGTVVAEQLAAWPEATVIDVASVKRAVFTDVERAGGDLTRFVGTHPMAGRERSGAISARRDLFEGRPWVVVPHSTSDPERVRQVVTLAESTGAVVRTMSARDHDEAVAAVSHVPQLASSLVAARLRGLPTESVALSGQGIRDVTRIAASDPTLWTQILSGNADAVRDVLGELADDLRKLVDALELIGDDPDREAPGARAALAEAIVAGNAGQARIPGKHGGGKEQYAVVTVAVPDEPGQLGRLFTEMGEENINLEDLHLEHEIGREVGIAEVIVVPAAADPLREALRRRGWRVYD
ncbi:MAG: prephenate dehydrogenase [Dermatophilus congolensis]|nr:prephenate dehydrogenase [Dermatophilus congolensis]